MIEIAHTMHGYLLKCDPQQLTTKRYTVCVLYEILEIFRVKSDSKLYTFLYFIDLVCEFRGLMPKF
jgi:hypothetical protein